MELKIFRDALSAAGTNCTLKAELPLETEILISDYLPPVFKLVKCFVRPVVLQKRLQPGKLQIDLAPLLIDSAKKRRQLLISIVFQRVLQIQIFQGRDHPPRDPLG